MYFQQVREESMSDQIKCNLVINFKNIKWNSLAMNIVSALYLDENVERVSSILVQCFCRLRSQSWWSLTMSDVSMENR